MSKPLVDIIIPAYNSHRTINRAIDSILQCGDIDYHITIVNDAGEPYNITNIDCLTELTYEKNMGPGYARNYGLEHTNGDYVVFLDADDYLLPNALKNLLTCISKGVGLVIGTIVAENPDGTTREIKSNGNFFHGKLYSRKFLEEYKIRCNEASRCCEDDSFNSLALLCLDGNKWKEVVTEEPVCRWTYTQGSLGRKNPIEWEHKIVPVEMITNKIYIYNQLKTRNVAPGRVLIDKTRTMIHAVAVYVRNKIHYPQYEQSNWNNLRRCYSEIYKNIESQVTDNIFDFVFNTILPDGSSEDKSCVKALLKELKYWDTSGAGKVDIIIPCYNSHKTLYKALSSIMLQNYPVEVTIVRDGGDNYKSIVENFSPYIHVREISYGENRGIAAARNFGLEHTHNDYVMFLDSDDVLRDTYSIELLVNEMKKDNAVIGIGGFLEETADKQFIPHLKDTGFIHGKMYRREYLNKHKIRFNENCTCNEDVGFNLLSMLLLKGEKVAITDNIVHFWLQNSESIVRKNRIEYEDKDSFIGYVNNMIYVYNELAKRGIDSQRIFEGKITVMERICLLYDKKTTRSPQYKNVDLEICKQYYKDVYKPIEKNVTDELFNKSYETLKPQMSKKQIKKFIQNLRNR